MTLNREKIKTKKGVSRLDSRELAKKQSDLTMTFRTLR